jgi:membrane protease YdiL (CAAX protease family)
MNINGSLFFWIIPPIVYYFINKKRGMDKKLILSNLMLVWSSWKYVILGLFIGIFVVVISVYIIKIGFFPDTLTNYSFVSNDDCPKNLKNFIMVFVLVGLTTAIGEEIFFRGFLGGIFIRKWGTKGNATQAFLFSLFHTLPVLIINVQLVLFAFLYSFIFGLVLGFLCQKSKSVIPSILAHSIGFPILFILL